MFKNLAIKGRFAALAAMLMASGTNWADRKHVSMSRKRDFPNTYHFWQGQNFQERNYKRTPKDDAKIDAAIAKRRKVNAKRATQYYRTMHDNKLVHSRFKLWTLYNGRNGNAVNEYPYVPNCFSATHFN